jgi:ribosomal protein L10
MKTIALALLLAVPALAQTEAPPADAAAELATTETLVLKVVGVLAIPIATLLATLLGLLTMWVKNKAGQNKLAGGAAVVLDLLGSYLAKAKAELAPLLRDALADGKLDPTEREVLKKKLIELVLRDAPADAVQAVTGVFGAAFPAWLEGKAEQAIDSMAAAAPSP